MSKKDLILIDAQNLAYRMMFRFKAKNKEERRSHSGKETAVISGFLAQIFSLKSKYPNSDVVICWDRKSKRRIALTDAAKRDGLIESGYKEERTALSEDDKETLSSQIAILKVEILPVFSVFQIEVNGFEADDVIYSYAKKFSDRICYIISSDRDFYQTLSFPNVRVIDCMNDLFVTKESFMKEYGFDPKYYVDYGAIVGEGGGGDNIPGVPKCGEKTAAQFVRLYGTTEEIFKALVGKENRTSKEESYVNNQKLLSLSYALKEMDYIDVPEVVIEPKDIDAAKKTLIKWGCLSLLKSVGNLCKNEVGE